MFEQSNIDIVRFEEIDSTNEEAKRLIRSGKVTKKTVLISKSQSLGHGRYGRNWVSKKGNLYTSIITKLDCSLDKAAHYSFIASVTVGDVVKEIIPADYEIEYKWPNDVLVNGAKVSGILLESLKDESSNYWLVIGVGVNINNCPEISEKTVVNLSSCVGSNLNVDNFFDKFINNFESKENLWKNKGFSCIRTAWLKNAHRLGDEITVNLSNKKFKGNFEGINDNGELEINVQGKKHYISSGEVFF